MLNERDQLSWMHWMEVAENVLAGREDRSDASRIKSIQIGLGHFAAHKSLAARAMTTCERIYAKAVQDRGSKYKSK